MKKPVMKSIAIASAVACALSLAACGNAGSSSSKGNEQTTLSLWSWDPTVEAAVKSYNASQNKIHIKVTNPGSGLTSEQYVALNNALQAGKGIPDMTLVEYMVLPQYSHMDAFLDLTEKGADKEQSKFTPGTWSSVNFNSKIYGMPVDSGPMAFFYNQEVFNKAGIAEPPKTWDEFYQDAKMIRATGSYITSDSGDGSFYNAMVWQAGGHPYKTKDNDVTINLTKDSGVQKFTKYWQKMLDEGLIDTSFTMWTDEWNKALGDGSIASLPSAAWMAMKLSQSAPQASGKFRVAKMPQWEAGKTDNAEWGGSSLAILKACPKEKQDAAWDFIKYVTTNDEGIKIRVDRGAFPATKATLKSDKFLSATTVKDANNKDVEYYGGQEFNKVFASAAADVKTKWSFLPFEIYARKVFGDSMGDAYRKHGTLEQGLEAWQKVLIKYAKDQGFTVK